MNTLENVQIDFWLFQHEETGQTMCIDAWQLENGFEKDNPRLQKIKPIYNQTSLVIEAKGLKSENKVLREIVESSINSTAMAIKKCQEINIFND